MADIPELSKRSRKLLARFTELRDQADRVLDELDCAAQQLASALLEDGLTLRSAAPLMSRGDLPICHAQVALARDGGRSRLPWAGQRKAGRG